MKRKNVMKVLIPLVALLICGIIVLLERNGVTSEYQIVHTKNEQTEYTEAVFDNPDCLILTCEADDVSSVYKDIITFVLDDMRIPYDILEITEKTTFDMLSQYETLVITFEDYSLLGKDLLTVVNWVKEGGHMMNLSTPIPNESFLTIAGKLGINNGGQQYTAITGLRIKDNYMLGGQEEQVYSLVEEGEEPLWIALDVALSKECEVLLTSEDGTVPLLWKVDYGEGSFVVFNDVLTEKYQRGFICLAYSMLEDVCIYPVINASAFYLDDFPSPVPAGNGEYIKRDYGVSTASFYSTIWWPKLLQWMERYGIRYTGVIIELYSDDVEQPFEGNYDEAQFLTYGKMLLNNGGELGFHGYNHMPLCIAGIDENLQYGEYELWKSKEDIIAAMRELERFSAELFPDLDFSVYVPPSNIISEAGREALLEACPGIGIIASMYLKDAEGYAYEQEFQVEENGIIDTPRIVSGLDLDDYQKITALSELNYHYAQSHFMHPDDLLDEDRGAAEGWETLNHRFEEYLDWVYTSVPHIRNVTGSEMGTAVAQYDSLSMERTLDRGMLQVRIGGFSGEAYFFMRINEGNVAKTEGCSCDLLTGNLYQVHATQDQIKIFLGE